MTMYTCYKVGYNEKRMLQVMACGANMRFAEPGEVTTVEVMVTCPYCKKAMEPEVETRKTGRYEVTYKDQLDGIVTTVFENKQEMDDKLDYLNAKGRLVEVVREEAEVSRSDMEQRGGIGLD